MNQNLLEVMMKRHCALGWLCGFMMWTAGFAAETLDYAIVDTGQNLIYNANKLPKESEIWYGQDADYEGNQPSYRDNGDGTVTDLNTGLMWQADPGKKVTYEEAVSGARLCSTGGHTDWRLPTVKELYSLIDFNGLDPDPRAVSANKLKPFINTKFFKFQYGKQSDGDRIIDSQWATSTISVGRVMNQMQAMFGVNFADGRIKGYPTGRTPRGDIKKFYVIYVRDNPNYGKNDFIDNGDGTVTDRATGLMWMQGDSGTLKAGKQSDGKMDWADALQWAEGLSYAGYDDWRLPNAKELQSIVDYTRSPDTTNSPALDPVFTATPIINEGGKTDFGFYWTSTTHAGFSTWDKAVYIAFGRALGFMQSPNGGSKTLMDVHGAGAQRSDPKSGSASTYPTGHGPQGDVIRINNFVRCVRGGECRLAQTKLVIGYEQSKEQKTAKSSDSKNVSDGAKRFIQRLDRDGDGKVSRQEFDGPANHFSDFDRNGDGYITADEAPSGPPRLFPNR